MNFSRPVVLFDGVCNLCNRGVQFIIKKDKKKKFLFASLQGKTGEMVVKHSGLATNATIPDTFILVEGDAVYTKSTAALKIARQLGGGWKLLYALTIVPRFMRDAVYTFIAKNRYRWFGKRDECMIPATELKERFLD